VAVDLKTPQERAIVAELAAKADVLVENLRPSSLRSAGLAYDRLRTLNPQLIQCSISGYGRDGPFAERAGYDFVMQAESGFMAITGEVAGEPMRLGVAFVDLAAGANATQAILAALYARERTGMGQSIDIALHDSALHFLANIASGYLNTGDNPTRFGNAHASIVPYQLLDTADGRVALAVGNNQQYRRLCCEASAARISGAMNGFAPMRRAPRTARSWFPDCGRSSHATAPSSSGPGSGSMEFLPERCAVSRTRSGQRRRWPARS
jgi:crotonobetainyl-CoA:carnitine CoA-transferase CaiB-like acyl-CoA transferase